MVSIARWLDTFTCSKYADRFERSGYSTLQSICELNSTQLQTLGISPTDICTITDNILLLKQSVNSLNPRPYLDLTSEPPFSISEQSSINNFYPSISSNDYLSSPSGISYYNTFYPTPPQYFSPSEQQLMYSHPHLIKSSLNHETQIIDSKNIINEIPESLSSSSNTPIISNLLTSNEQNGFNKNIYLNTHPIVASLLTENVVQTPLPSITSLQQKNI